MAQPQATLIDSRDPAKAALGTLVTFEWPHEGASDVRLTGDFLGWVATGIPMLKEGDKWVVTLRLTPGRAAYKFICDGEAWLYSPAQKFTSDEFGNINNIVDVPGAAAPPSPPPAAALAPGLTIGVPPPAGAPASSPVPPLLRSATTPVGHHAGGGLTLPDRGDPPGGYHQPSVSSGAAAPPATPPDATRGHAPHPALPLGSAYVAKAVREHTAEFSLPVEQAAGSKRTALTRSASVGDVASMGVSAGGGRLGALLGPRGGGLLGSDYGARRLGGGVGAGGGLASGSGTPRHTGRAETSPLSTGGWGGGGGADGGSLPAATPVLVGAPPPPMALPGHSLPSLSIGSGGGSAGGGGFGGRDTADMSVLSPLPESAAESLPESPGATPSGGSLSDLVAAVRGSVGLRGGRGGRAGTGGGSDDAGGDGGDDGDDAGLCMDEPAPAPAGGQGISLSVSAQLLSSLVPALAAQQQAQAAVAAARAARGGAALPPIHPASPATSTAPGSPAAGAPAAPPLPKVPSDSATPPVASSPMAASLGALSKSMSSGGSLHAAGGAGVGAGALGGGSSYPHAPGAAIQTPAQASLLREGKLVLAFVGAPAVGKTFMARRLKRHLTWTGFRAEIFNVGNFRRALLGAQLPADFFSPHNPVGEAQRSEVARIAFDDMCAALHSGVCDIAIFDATNSTRERRAFLKGALAEQERRTGVKHQLVFIESVCTDEAIVRANVRETKLKSPDYRDVPEDAAVADFLARIKHYKSVYQTLDEVHDGEQPFIKLVDVGRVLVANRINGYLNSRIMWFLSHLHITP